MSWKQADGMDRLETKCVRFAQASGERMGGADETIRTRMLPEHTMSAHLAKRHSAPTLEYIVELGFQYGQNEVCPSNERRSLMVRDRIMLICERADGVLVVVTATVAPIGFEDFKTLEVSAS